ncbi:MAG: exonuclease domain-containing protein [Candidatus Egerieousia sp.]
MKLNLKRPIVFFDIESTGLDVAKDRIVEISAVKVFPDGHNEVKTRRVNPNMEIPAEATAIHHITNEDVANEPEFKQIAKSLAQWMEGCDFAGYNFLKFDIPLLEEEFLRCNIQFDFGKKRLIDVQNIFHKMEQRNLIAAYKFYCKKDLLQAHSAEADTMATYEVLEAQLDKYADTLENDVQKLADFSSRSKFVDYAGRIVYNDKNQAVFNFGKHKGRLVTEVLKSEPSYYSWILNGDFTLNTKRVLTDIKLHPENYNGEA